MAEMQTNCILIASNFIIHPQVLIFSVFKTASLSLIANKIFYQNLVLVAEYRLIVDKQNNAVTSAVTKFRCHKLIAKVNK